MWEEELKEAGVNIHVIATGAGAGLQQVLWEVPGSSAYLSGCSFPYSAEEQEELLGFMPEHFCSEEAAIDLASAAYMKAYKFGGKKPVGVGITASVASDREHRGDLRVFVCVISNTKAVVHTHTFNKEVGKEPRLKQGHWCDVIGRCAILEAYAEPGHSIHNLAFTDVSEKALARFFLRPFFTANGKRLDKLPKEGRYALMPGAFNPPHEGHYGAATAAMTDYNYKAVFEVTAKPPHKDALTVQELLQRAKLLQGQDRLFTTELPYYLDKARKYPKRPFILGADAMVRMLDPKWGLDAGEMFNAFYDLSTKLFIASREVDGHMTTCENILSDIKAKLPFKVWATAHAIMMPLKGEWNISSTELRNKKI